ncbi:MULTISPECIES: AAA family ATPase [unclassified Schlesneria]|uniref:AAA family ATPase n=1 Tax=unclassified Schlesneria TaxID=2762017 RepID=UPI002F0242B0
MNAIWEFIQQQLATNQLFGGGLILMVTGGLLAYFREVPERIWQWLRRCWLLEIDILDRDPAFEWIDKWLAQHTYSQHRARSLTVKTVSVDYTERQADPTMDARPRILFSPAPGEHIFFYRGRLVILNRERPKPDGNNSQSLSVRESFSIHIFSRDRNIARQLLEDARDVAVPAGDNRLAIHRASYSSWDEQMKRLPRPPESVVLRAGLMESLIDDVRDFLGRRNWYIERGIPYRRGYLLYGPPGTGKSSAVLAIASALKMDIAILSLANSSLDDDDLCQLLSNCPVNSIVLIEDIDCVFVERKATEDKANKLTFSGLLNAIDGVAAGEGRILFATTNHIERLDPALIRPGRIDRKELIGYANQEQLRRLFVRFFGDDDPSMADYFAESLVEGTLPMSAVQTYLIQHADSADDALLDLDELIAEGARQIDEDTSSVKGSEILAATNPG